MKGEHLTALLRATGRLTLLVEVGRALALAAAVLLAAGLAALGLDAVAALSAAGLIAVDMLLLLLLAGALGFVTRQGIRHRANARRTARQVELKLGLTDNRLINAVDFSGSTPAAVSGELLAQSIDAGDEFARNIWPIEAADFRRLWLAVRFPAAAVFVVLLAYLCAPRVFGMVIPRYLEPTADHPPYSLLEFDISWVPENVYHGQPVTVSAIITGPDLPDRANVVFVAGSQRQVVPMQTGIEDGQFLLPIERAEESRRFFIDTPKGRSRHFTLSVLQVPFVESAHASYRYPAYTGWAEQRHALDGRGIGGLVGTDVEISARGNLPLESGTLELYRDKEQADGRAVRRIRLAPVPVDPQAVRGTFRLEESGRFRLSLFGAGGNAGSQPLEGSLTAVADRAPRVAVTEPFPHVLAVASWKLAVTVQAVDDVGIARIVLHPAVNGWRPWPLELTVERQQPALARARHEFDLAALGAREGDTITYFATAYDNHPGGGQIAETATGVIQVIGEEQYLQFARQDYQLEELLKEFDSFREQLDRLEQHRDKLLNELADLPQKLAAGRPLSPEELRRWERLQQALEQFSRRADELAEQLRKRLERPQLYDIEPPYKEMLAELAEALHQQAHSAGTLAAGIDNLRQHVGDAAAREECARQSQRFAERHPPFDQKAGETLRLARQDLDRLQKADALLAAAEQLRNAVLEQRELADRLGEFRSQEKLTPQEQQRVDRLAKQQELLEQDLAEAVRQLEQAAEAAQDDLPQLSGDALALCRSVRDMNVAADQQQASRTARAGSCRNAFAAADRAAQKLETLLTEVPQAQGVAGELEPQLDGPLKLPQAGLATTLGQLAQGRLVPGLGSRPQENGGLSGPVGSGRAGSQARVVVLGPHSPAGVETAARLSRAEAISPAGLGVLGADGKAGLGPERLTPQPAAERRITAGNMHGVPVRYRDQAEAYFKRLAAED